MIVAPAFEPVRRAFQENFDAGEELGARFTVVINQQVVVDLWGGFADRERTKAFDQRTLAPVFSTTKAIASILIARLVESGRLSYRQPVAEVWPAFAAAGKAKITVEQVMSHQAGLPGFIDEMDPALWFDWNAICDKLAAMAPMWTPGTASGYHPITFGYLAGEIFRRVDGRTMGTALREDIAGPLGLDLFIGLPDAEFPRVASLERPKSLPKFGELNAATRAAFLTPWASPGGRGTDDWRRAEIPSANGHATAHSLALLMGALASGGMLNNRRILSGPLIEEAARERIAGQDLVLPQWMSWGAGFMRNAGRGVYGPGLRTFGHSGWGGSCAFADPDKRLGGAYVMNKQRTELVSDVRAKKLIDTLYSCL